MALTITTPEFKHEGRIPAKIGCEGQDSSPQLHWSGVPQNCQSLVLISDDPDAPDPQNPKMTWVHWVVYDLPPDSSGLDERQPKEGTLANGAKQGITDFGSIGYGGPCPPIGEHRYYFKLYALDTRLDLPPGQSKKNIEEAMAGHILEQAELIGLYQKKGT
jgi:hypothetical protein